MDGQTNMEWLFTGAEGNGDPMHFEELSWSTSGLETGYHPSANAGFNGASNAHGAGFGFSGWSPTQATAYPPLGADVFSPTGSSPTSSPASSFSSPEYAASSGFGSDTTSGSPIGSPCSDDSGLDIWSKIDTDPIVLSVMQEGMKGEQVVIAVQPEEPTRSRKRKRMDNGYVLKEDVPSIDVLSKEQIARMSSEQFEEYSRCMLQRPNITAADRKILSAQRRQIKNREYAQEARRKKKAEQQQLESRLNELEEENARLKQENSSLRAKVIELVNGMRRLRAFLPDGAQRHETGDGSKSFAAQFSEVVSGFTSIRSNNGATSGVCLLVLLLSVGILFNMNSDGAAGRAPGASASGGSSAGTGRVILGANDGSWWSTMSEWAHVVANALARAVTGRPTGTLRAKRAEPTVWPEYAAAQEHESPVDVTAVEEVELGRSESASNNRRLSIRMDEQEL